MGTHFSHLWQMGWFDTLWSTLIIWFQLMTSVGLFSETITGNKLITVSSWFLGLITRDMKIQRPGSNTYSRFWKTIWKKSNNCLKNHQSFFSYFMKTARPSSVLSGKLLSLSFLKLPKPMVPWQNKHLGNKIYQFFTNSNIHKQHCLWQ
jgi:hypothetical protein